MSDTETLTFDRVLDASADRVFAALTEPEHRRIWNPPDAESVVLIDEGPAPAPGGREWSSVGPRDNPYVRIATDWVILTPPAQLVYTETLHAEGSALGVSLAAFTLAADGPRTRLSLVVQVHSFVGPEMLEEYRGGWTHAVESLIGYVTS